MTRTPWLTTRRRTCPICKGDVVRSLQRSERSRSGRSNSLDEADEDEDEDVEGQLFRPLLGGTEDVDDDRSPAAEERDRHRDRSLLAWANYSLAAPPVVPGVGDSQRRRDGVVGVGAGAGTGAGGSSSWTRHFIAGYHRVRSPRRDF
jgi:hypothetical protein